MKFDKNVMPKALLILLAFTLTLASAGCKKEGCTDPLSSNYDPDAKEDDGSCQYSDANFSLHVNHMVGSEPYSTSTTYHTTDGRHYKFTIARFYISDNAVHTATGHEHLEEYMQIVAGTSHYDLGVVPPNGYEEFEFHLGLDSAANHSDPTTYATGHALAATSSTFDHWSWNSGYIFLKVEGLADTSAAMNGTIDGPFTLHIGGDSFLRTISLAKDFSIASGQDFDFEITIDWEKVLNGIDLRNAITHTMDNMPLAEQVTTNFLGAISVD